MTTAVELAADIERGWDNDPRWARTTRGYNADAVVKLRGSFVPEHTIARRGAERLWALVNERDYVHTLGAMTGGQAVQMVKAGLEAIYLSGWQVAGDANLAEQVYPDQSLYPVNSVPTVVRRINNALRRADQIEWAETGGNPSRDWMVPIVADAEAGFGGALNAYELMRSMIEAGAAAVHWEDQLASEKKCGHMGGKVLIPTAQHIRTLIAARLAADVLDVPTLVIARTDALGATLITSDVDERDREFLTGERSAEGFFYTQPGLDVPIKRAIAYAPYADLIWCETSTPDLDEARRFAEAVKAVILTYCSRTTARRRSTGVVISMTTRSSASRRNSVRWVTHSSSSRSPAGTHSTIRCSTSPAPTTTATWPATSRSRTVSSRPRQTVTRQPVTRPRSAPDISTTSQRSSPAGTRRRSPSRAAPRKPSSTETSLNSRTWPEDPLDPGAPMGSSCGGGSESVDRPADRARSWRFCSLPLPRPDQSSTPRVSRPSRGIRRSTHPSRRSNRGHRRTPKPVEYDPIQTPRVVEVILRALIYGGVAVAAVLLLLNVWRHRPQPQWRRLRRRRRRSVQFEVLDDVAAVINADADAQRAALQRGSPRNAIVECWLRLEAAVVAAGVPRDPADTSTELTVRVLATHHVDPVAIARLAALYREARFSDHPMGEDARRAAIDALDDVHDGLRTDRITVDATA